MRLRGLGLRALGQETVYSSGFVLGIREVHVFLGLAQAHFLVKVCIPRQSRS